MDNTMILKDYISHWLKTVKQGKIKPATYDRLISSFETLHFYDIASIPLIDITPEDCEAYVDQLASAGYALTTIKKQMLIVSAPIKYAFEHRVIPFNPAACMKPPSKALVQKAKKQVEAYTPEQQEALRNVLRQWKHPAALAIELMLETGMRPGEVLAFEKADIDLDRQFIYVHRTMVNLCNKRLSYVQDSAKSDTSNRRVPLSRRALEIATAILKSRKPYPFTMHKDRISYESLHYQCSRICNKSGVPFKGLHIFRHTFATNLFYKGVNIKILSKILGHSEPSVTMNIYIHLYGDGFSEMLSAVS